MKAILEKNEFSIDAAKIYFDLDKQSGKAIDNLTDFKYSHNTGELTISGVSRTVTVFSENILYDSTKGQLLICTDLSKQKERIEIILNNLSLLHFKFSEDTINKISDFNFKAADKLVKYLFWIDFATKKLRGSLPTRQPINITELNEIISANTEYHNSFLTY